MPPDYPLRKVMTKEEIDEVIKVVRRGLELVANHDKWFNRGQVARKDIYERTQATRKRNREAKLAAQAKETTK